MSPFSDMKAEQEHDRVWRALADPTRRSILDLLSKAPLTTGQIVAEVPELSRTGVMKHLDVLEAAGLLLIRRAGRVRWNHMNPIPIQTIYERWVAGHVRNTASAALRLKARAESATVRVPKGNRADRAESKRKEHKEAKL